MEPVQSFAKADVFKSCVAVRTFSKEMVVQRNMLIRVVSGGMRLSLADRTMTLSAGDTIFFPRNGLCKVVKYPENGVPYQAVSITLTQHSGTSDIRILTAHPLLDSLFDSMLPYFRLSDELPEDISKIKTQEAISILKALGIEPSKEEPPKIDLKDFMEHNYMFNLPIERFGYLTGRSLTTFKRDFKKTYNTTPQRWLTQKRLALAHDLLQTKKPTDVYLDAGFENLSHFSYAYKKQYGHSPRHENLPQ